MKVVVFEDNKKFAANLERIIRQCTHHPTSINTDDIADVTCWVEKTTEPVLYFLDIVIGDETLGFSLAELISEQNNGSLIVFLTDYPQKINYNPYFKTKAFSVIYKNNPSLDNEIENTILLAQKVLQSKCLYIHVDKFQTLYIPYENICYVEKIKKANKLCVHCTDGQYIIRETLEALLKKLLPFGFTRCHKSIIVNKSNIRKCDKPNMILVFHNGISCPYSYLYYLKGGLSEKP